MWLGCSSAGRQALHDVSGRWKPPTWRSPCILLRTTVWVLIWAGRAVVNPAPRQFAACTPALGPARYRPDRGLGDSLRLAAPVAVAVSAQRGAPAAAGSKPGPTEPGPTRASRYPDPRVGPGARRGHRRPRSKGGRDRTEGRSAEPRRPGLTRLPFLGDADQPFATAHTGRQDPRTRRGAAQPPADREAGRSPDPPAADSRTRCRRSP